jgi:8-oxo-dGTP pyrophosphatase MutT (NUDIX family)
LERCDQHGVALGHHPAGGEAARRVLLAVVETGAMSTGKMLNFQYAALPYRRRAGNTLEIMLITSRDSGRWVIPKGWPVTGETAWDSAAREAQEEAGLVGRISRRAVGRYHYEKFLEDGSSVWCMVEVFALEVEQQLASWPERGQRLTRWFALDAAAEAVDEPELGGVIRELPAHLPAE